MAVSKASLSALLVRAGVHTCAIPVEHARECLRPLPVEPVAGAPAWVWGLSVLRGAPTPVVLLGKLLDGEAATPADSSITRFLSLRVGDRGVALAVDAVPGVRSFAADALQELPPLLSGANDGLVQSLATLDGDLLLVLRAARLVPEEFPS